MKILVTAFEEFGNVKGTNSLYAKDILKNIKINDFVKIIPNDYYSMLKLLDKYKDEENFELKAFEEAIR